jgi:DNA-binding NarL/FixJ family response regulator
MPFQPYAALGPWERAVFDLFTTGATDEEICSKLNIQREWMANAIDRITAAFGVDHRVDLTKKVLPLLIDQSRSKSHSAGSENNSGHWGGLR